MEKLEYVVRVNAGQKVQPKIISIRGTTDMFDRYKMRQLFVQVIGKGKMIRTVFLNVDDVAKDLKTEPACTFSAVAPLRISPLGVAIHLAPRRPRSLLWLRARLQLQVRRQEVGTRARVHFGRVRHAAALAAHEEVRARDRSVPELPPARNHALPRQEDQRYHLPLLQVRILARTSFLHRTHPLLIFRSQLCASCSHTGVMKVDNSKFLKFMTTHPPTVVNTKNIQAKQAAKQAAAAGEAPEAANGDKKDDKEAKPAAASSEARPKAAKPKPRVGALSLLIVEYSVSSFRLLMPVLQTRSTTTTGR